ncbi:MAG: 30S ribosomal protein S20 [Alphaproteobacteria bacterium]|nr:30S ribosomal protein S20 [Alphaproteobacteria bacterium]
MADTKLSPVMKKKRKKLSNIRNAEKKRLINISRKSRIKTFIAKFEKAILDKLSKEEISKAFSAMQSELMRGVSKKVIKKGTASRKISRMSTKLKVALA